MIPISRTKLLAIVVVILVIGIVAYAALPQLVKPQTKRTLKLGAVEPFTGPQAYIGEYNRNGLELAKRNINAAGGINGYQIDIVYEDDKGDPATAVTAAKKLISVDGVPVIFTTQSGVSGALAPLAVDSKIVLFANALYSTIVGGGQYVFRVETGGDVTYRAVLSYVYGDLKLGNMGILSSNRSPYTGWVPQVTSDYQKMGGRVVISVTTSPTATDFRTELTKIRAENINLMIAMGYGPDAGTMVKQARELGITAVVMGHDEFSPGTGFLEAAGPAAEGVIFGAGFFNPADTSAEVQTFTKAYKETFQKDTVPMLYAADHYDNLYAVAKAATDGACLTDAGMNVDCLRTSILQLHGFTGLTGPMAFLPNGDISKPVNVYRWEKGGTISLIKTVMPTSM